MLCAAKTDESLHQRALHFAAHAFFAHVQEIPVVCLRLHEEPVALPDRGDARFIDPGVMLDLPLEWPVPTFVRSKLAEHIIQIALAGTIAEQVLNDKSLDLTGVVADECDWGLAWKAGEHLWSNEDGRLKWIAREAVRLSVSLRLECYRHPISMLADALLKARVLDRASIRAVIDRANRDVQADWSDERQPKRSAPISVTPLDSELMKLDERVRHVAARAAVAAHCGVAVRAARLPEGRVSIIGSQELGDDIVFEPGACQLMTGDFRRVRKFVRVRLAGAAIDWMLHVGPRNRVGVERTEDWRRARDILRRTELPEELLKTEFECVVGMLSLQRSRKAVLDVAAELNERGFVTGGSVERMLTNCRQASLTSAPSAVVCSARHHKTQVGGTVPPLPS